MVIEINTIVSIGDTFGRQKVGNLTLEDAKFWGRPNFSGEEDRFRDSRRKFTVLIPNEVADQLRNLGWNVKTTLPTEENPDVLSSLKVMVDENSANVFLTTGDGAPEKLTPENLAVIDRSRIERMDMEIRAWEYDPDERPGMYSARLVTLIAVIRPNRLADKYGMMI